MKAECLNAFKLFLINEKSFDERYAGDYRWGAALWFAPVSAEAAATDRWKSEALKAKPLLEEFARRPEFYKISKEGAGKIQKVSKAAQRRPAAAKVARKSTLVGKTSSAVVLPLKLAKAG